MNVEHYLGVYKLRKRMIDEGISNTTSQERNLINEVVNKLSERDPLEKIKLTNKDGKLILSDVNGDHLISGLVEL